MLEPITNFKVYKESEVKITYMGNIIEKMYLSRRNKEATVQRLPDNKILILRTGEIKELKPMETRIECKNSLKRTMRNLRNLLNANIDDVSKCRWVTLTYAENMTDAKRLYQDFKKFILRFQYYCKKMNYGKFEYIVAMEPQGRGAWHAHVVFIFDHTAPFIENDVLRDIWGFGFVTIKKLDDVDNVGAYLTAYLGDMEMDETIQTQGLDKVSEMINKGALKEVTYEENGIKKNKYYIKGGRLGMYPAGFNLYRNSRGVKKPIEEYCTEEQARKKVSAATLTFQSTHLYTNPEDGFECIIDKKYYNSKRSVTQEVKIEQENNLDLNQDECIYQRATFMDEVRYAHSRVDWLPMYDRGTGEILVTPFDL